MEEERRLCYVGTDAGAEAHLPDFFETETIQSGRADENSASQAASLKRFPSIFFVTFLPVLSSPLARLLAARPSKTYNTPESVRHFLEQKRKQSPEGFLRRAGRTKISGAAGCWTSRSRETI